MKRELFFGIDLGTSNCSVAFVIPRPQRDVPIIPKVVEFDVDEKSDGKEPRFPSVVCKNPRSPKKLLFGFAAEKYGNWLQAGGTFFRSIKSLLGTWRSFVDAFSPDVTTPVKVWAKLIEHLCKQASRRTPEGIDPRDCYTILTVPASFSAQQRQETIEAAELAGFRRERVQLIDEPVAALLDWIHSPEMDWAVRSTEPQNVMVFDFGGGTCDLSLVEVQYAKDSTAGVRVRNLAISPFQLLGGDTIDLAILEYLWPQIETRLGVTRGELSTQSRQFIEHGAIRTCRTLKHKMCDAMAEAERASKCRKTHRKIGDVEALLPAGLLADSGRRAGGKLTLSADDFGRIMAPFIDRNGGIFQVNAATRSVPFARLIEATLAKAGMAAFQLDVILMHGGSCKNPLVRRALESLTGQDSLFGKCVVVQTPDLDASVAKGAAIHSYFLNHQKRWFVHPITSDNVGIITKGDMAKVVVPAGTPLPYPEVGWKTVPDEFLLADDNQQHMLVPVFVGQPRNGYLPNVAASRVFDLPPGVFRGQPIEVNIRIDENKLVQWRFRPKGAKDWVNEDPWKHENPWSQLKPSSEEEELLRVRAEIRSTLDARNVPPPRTLAYEAYATANAGYLEEALRLIESAVRKASEDAGVWCWKGLVHSRRGEIAECAAAYKRGWDLAPNDGVIRGNYGTALVRLRRYDEAIEIMRGALASDPAACRYLHSWVVDALDHLGRVVEAREEVQRWLNECRRQTAAGPEYAEGWDELQRACIRAGLHEEADGARKRYLGLMRERHYGGSAEYLLESREF